MIYRIKDWVDHFESAKSKTYDRCSHAYIPNKQDGDGVTYILCQPDGLAVFGAWYLLIEALSMQNLPRQGYCTDTGRPNGIPWTAEILARRWRRTETEIQRMLDVIVSPEVGWAEIVKDTTRIPRGYHKDTSSSSKKDLDSDLDSDSDSDSSAPESAAMQIYKIYPRRQGREKALPKIESAIKAKGFEYIQEATRAFALAVASWPPGDEQFIPHPSTWFNQGRYDDDRITWKRSGGHNGTNRVNTQSGATRAGHQDPGHAKDYADLASRAFSMSGEEPNGNSNHVLMEHG